MKKLLILAAIFSIYSLKGNSKEKENPSCIQEIQELSPHLVQTQDNRGITSYKLNEFSQLQKVDLPDGRSIEYQYDFRNNLSKLIYPNKSEISFHYDLDNRLEKISQPMGDTSFEYDHIKNLLITKTFPNGIRINYGYDHKNHINEIAISNDSEALLGKFKYEFDENGNRTCIQRLYLGSIHTINYKYDTLNRLLEANYSDGYYEHFNYDGIGNRLTKSTPDKTTRYSYNAENQLIQYDDIILSYDQLGNLQKKETAYCTTIYSYNEQNLLSKVECRDSIIVFEYDVWGNRISKTVNGIKTHYINDLRTPLTNVLVEEREGNSIQYCYAGGIHSSESNKGNDYYLFDSPNRNVSFVANEEGCIENHYEYSSFGELRNYNKHEYNNHLFSGQQYDEETGLIYLRNRYYDPETGRFISKDPYPGTPFNPQTLNPYTYVLNNPVNLIDLTGRHEELPPEGMVFYDVCAYDRVPWYLHLTRTGHGWQEFKDSKGETKSIGHYPLTDTDGIIYFRVDEHLHQFFPESRINTLRFTISEAQADLIYQTTAAFCSDLYHLFTHNCIDAVKAGMDAAEISHPDFKTFGISDPLKLHQYIQFENFKNNVKTQFSNFIDWFKTPSPGIQSQTLDNATSLYFNSLSQPDFGGVSLSTKAEMLCELPEIKGVIYDHNLGQMVFFGPQGSLLPKMNFDHLAVAIRSLYGLGSNPPRYPGVSIDSSKDSTIHTVRYDGATEGTHFGWVMFEADRLLKCLVAGIDNLTGKKMTPSVPGYISLVDRYKKSKKSHETQSSRFWFIPERIQLKQSTDGKAIIFSDVKMKVCHESSINNKIHSNPYLTAFANHFSDNFNAYSQEFPIFKELLELGKITAIVKWIHDNQIPIDLEYFRYYQPRKFNTPSQTKTIATAYAHAGKLFFITGGVVYACNNQNTFFKVSDSCNEIEEELLKERINEETFTWCSDNKDLLISAKSVDWVETRKPGNFKRSHVDLSFPVLGNHELKFIRYYNSFNNKFSPLGYGWEMLPYTLHPMGEYTEVFFEDGSKHSAYKLLILRDNDHQKSFVLSGIDIDNNLIYSCDKCSELIYVHENLSFTLKKNKGKNIFFSSKGLPMKEVDAFGIELYYHYRNDCLTSITHQNGSSIEFEYNNGRLSRAWKPKGPSIYYHYDNKGQLERVSNALGDIEYYAYDQDLRLLKILDAEKNVIFTGSYDSYSRLITHTKNNLTFEHTYDLLGKYAKLSLDSTLFSETTFNDDNYPLLINNTFNQNHAFNHTNSTIEKSEGWSYEYNPLGYLISISDPLDRKTSFSYDFFGNLVTKTLPNGNIIQSIYDEKNKLRTIYYKCSLEYCASYHFNEVHLQSFNDLFYSVNYDYDEWGNLVSIQHATGPYVLFEHDKNGRVIKTTTGMGYCVKREYDECSKLKWIDDPGGVFTEFEYDTIGRLIGTSKNGSKTSYTYFPNGMISSITDPLGNITSYFYDSLGRLEEVIDPEGIRTLFDYNNNRFCFYQD